MSESWAGQELPRGQGQPTARGTLSAEPEDFRVTEIEKFRPAGSGTHAWLKIRKRGVNTEEVATELARIAGVRRTAVGFAGMKDRLAVAIQWFSVDLAGRSEPRWSALESESVDILEVSSHLRKLRRGALLGNRFEVVLRETSAGITELRMRLNALRTAGVPNYFGPQRFGRDGGNLRLARSLLVDGRRIRDRHRRGLALSAARSHVFNRVLAARVGMETWSAPMRGDVMVLDRRGSVFALDPADETAAARMERGEIHPTGPLWGRGRRMVADAARETEDRIVAESPALCQGLERERVEQARRPLRVMVPDLDCRAQPGRRMTLEFSLPPGAYASTVLMELFTFERFR